MAHANPECSRFKNKLAGLLTNRYFVLGFILAVGAFLRLYDLNGKSLWYDEACSLNVAAYNWRDIIFDHNLITHIPRPVYFILLKLWTGLFGYTEIAARSLSVIFGTTAILLIYILARFLFGSPTGLISAFMLAVSSYNIYFSQQARYYSLFLFLALISMILFFRILKNNDLGPRIAYISANILIIYTFPLGVYILVLQNIFFLLLRKRIHPRIKWMRMQIIMCIVFIPVVLFPLMHLNHRHSNYDDEKFSSQKPSINSLIDTFDTFSYGGSRQGHAGVGFEVEPSRLRLASVSTIFFSLIFALSIFYRKKEIPEDADFISPGHKVLILWLWLFAPLIGLFLFSIWIKPVFLTRYFIGVAPAFYIGIGYGVYNLKKIRPVLILTIVVLSFFSLSILYNPGSANDWRKLGNDLKPLIKNGDIIVFAPVMQIIPFWYYYKYDRVKNFNNNIDNYGEKFYHRKNCGIFYDSNFMIGFGLNEDINLIYSALAALPDKKADVWLVISPGWIGKNYARSIGDLLITGRKIKYQRYFEYDGVEVIGYRSD